MLKQQTQEPPLPIDTRAGIMSTDNSATIALLEHWAAVDAKDDPQVIAQAERDWADLNGFGECQPPTK